MSAARMWVAVVAVAAIASCSHPRAKGRIVVAVSVDWEGGYFSSDGLDAMDALRKTLGDVPFTHFVSAAYFTKPKPDPRAAQTIADAVHPGDELAVHLHAWQSLAVASSVEPKPDPSFMTGTDQLLEFDDGDVGFDTDFDVYSVLELRAMLRTSRKLLEQTKLPVSKTFRAGGYLGTRKVLQALHEEGFTTDSSALDYHKVDFHKEAFLARRVRELWPKVDPTTQPFQVAVQGGQLVEMPIALAVDDAEAADIVHVIEVAHDRLQKDAEHDVFVTLELYQESAHDGAPRVADAIQQVRARKDLGDVLLFTTVERAAELARGMLAPAK